MAEYQTWSPDAADEAQDADDAAKQNKEFWKFREGERPNRARFIGPVHGFKQPFADVSEHAFKKGPQHFIRFNCPEVMAEKKDRRHCPVCEEVRALRATGDQADYDLAGDMRAQRVCVWQAIDVDRPELGVRKVEARPRKKTGGLHEPFIELMRLDKIDFTHPETGIVLNIYRTGQKIDTNYKVVHRGEKALPLDAIGDGDLSISDWLELATDLSTLIRVPSDEEIDRILNPRSGGRDDSPRAKLDRKRAGRGERTAQDALKE